MSVRIDWYNPDAARWRKSSYSDDPGAACVEIADAYHLALVPVRDSKDPHGPAPVFTPAAWTAFVDAVTTGDLPA